MKLSDNEKQDAITVIPKFQLEDAHGSLRFTLGKYTTAEEIDYTVKALADIVKKLRAMSPLYKGGK